MTPLVRSFSNAFRPYVRSRLETLGVAPDEYESAISAGREWLMEQLDALVTLPFGQQPRGPLELFQEALRFPTGALAAAGVAVVVRDEVATNALPGDVYNLAPASSRDLGDEAWETHLAWGVAKAKAMTAAVRPRVGYYGTNLIDRSKIEAVASAAGFELAVYRAGEQIDDVPGTVFVDLEASASDEAIRAFVGRGARVVAFGPHVDDIAMVRARSLGANDVTPRSRFFRDIAGHMPTLM